MNQLKEIKARAAGHTPGPWFAHQDFIDMGVEDATKTITNSPERYAGKFIASVGLDFEVKSANADLMAAAPKLLAALEAVEAICDNNDGTVVTQADGEHVPVHLIRKAIAEALQ